MNEQDELDIVDDEMPLQVEYWPLDRLILYARNARTHSAAQIAEIAGSIRAFARIPFWSATAATSSPATVD